MTRLKNASLWLIALILLGAVSTWIHVVTKTVTDFESLLLCSEGNDDLIPKALCQSYLFNFGGNPAEIAALNQGIGVGWVMRAEDDHDRRKLVSFLLQKGVDINAIDRRSGTTALHTAVFENNFPAVELLLSNGANPSTKDRARGKTPLEFALELKNKSDQPDRTAIIKLLENSPKN